MCDETDGTFGLEILSQLYVVSKPMTLKNTIRCSFNVVRLAQADVYTKYDIEAHRLVPGS